MENTSLIIGIDFGTDSVRCLLVNAESGEELASTMSLYKRWNQQAFCDPSRNQFRQHPLDYLEGMEESLVSLISGLSKQQKANIVAMGVDTTGSTPIAVDEEGAALSLTPQFQDDPNAMFYLWKDHTAIKEADEITALSKNWGGVDYTTYSGGSYSSEWFWAKLLKMCRTSPEVADATFSWVEHCDWITGELTGNTKPDKLYRSQCAAGHKAMFHEDWGGLPSAEFLHELNPKLSEVAATFNQDTKTSDCAAGTISEKWAEKLGLSREVIIAVGLLDAHAGAIGGGVGSGSLLKVIGTSTCDLAVSEPDKLDYALPGIASQATGSMLPGLIGLEAGQSAFGDIYAWFKDTLLWCTSIDAFTQSQDAQTLNKTLEVSLLNALSEQAERIDSTSVLALDFWNGRRSPYLNSSLKGAIHGLTLGTSAPEIFKSLVESTAFGSKRILMHFKEHGVDINDVIAVGGIAKKSTFVMQTLANVFDMPVHVARSDQACALGAAIGAAVASGIYPKMSDAQAILGSRIQHTYHPQKDKVSQLDATYKRYLALTDATERLLN